MGEIIKNYLKSKGIKFNTLANALGYEDSIITTMLNGKRKISTDEYYIICQTLGLKPNYFYEIANRDGK